MSDVPRVTVSPTEGRGLSLINGQQTDVIAELILLGRDGGEMLGLTKHEVIVACWYEAMHGVPMFRNQWAMWARYVQIELGRGELGLEDIPMPPRQMRDHDPGE